MAPPSVGRSCKSTRRHAGSHLGWPRCLLKITHCSSRSNSVLSNGTPQVCIDTEARCRRGARLATHVLRRGFVVVGPKVARRQGIKNDCRQAPILPDKRVASRGSVLPAT